MHSKRYSKLLLPLGVGLALMGCGEDPTGDPSPSGGQETSLDTTPTASATQQGTPTASATASAPQQSTPTASATATATASATATATASATATATASATASATPTATATATATQPPTPEPTPTATLVPVIESGVSIVGPRDGDDEPAEVSLSGNYTLPISYVTANFATRQPGTCLPEDYPCGHVRILVDGTDGNQTGQSYNAIGWQSPILADFSTLDTPSGLHTVTLQLLDDDGEAIEVDGEIIQDEVSISVGLTPELSITLPADSTVRIGNDEDRSVQIPFTLVNYALEEPGNCAGIERCGHLLLQVDGDLGNAPDMPYNNVVSSTPANARLVELDPPAGEHTITLTLVDDDDEPVLVDGIPLSASVQINAVEVAPTLNLVSPDDGSQVVLSELGAMNLRFAAANFILAEAGSCQEGDLPDCGYVQVNLDGDDGNQGGLPYHLATATSPATVDFSVLDEPEGQHTLTVQLMYNNGEPVIIDNGPVSDELTILTINADGPSIRVGSPNPGDEIRVGTDAEQTVPVSYTVDNFTIAPPGSCGELSDCGHLSVHIDASAGNQTGMDYNNLAFDGNAGVAEAFFAQLDEPLGEHTVTLALLDDDGQAVEVAGSPIEVSVTFTTLAGDIDLQISGLDDGDTVRLGNDELLTVLVPYLSQDFTVVEPGSCTGDERQKCGSIAVYVDGQLNNTAGSNPAEAYFVDLLDPTGEHTISLQLIDNNYQPVLEDGETVEASVTLTTQIITDPYIRIVTPSNDDEITIRTDQYTSPMTYNVAGYSISQPGQPCAATPEGESLPCGHIRLNIDGDAGNQDGLSYNNVSYTGGVIQALFEDLDPVEGAHTLSLTLFDNGTLAPAVTSDGQAVTVEVAVTVIVSDEPIEVPDDPSITIISPVGVAGNPANITLSSTYTFDTYFATYGFDLQAPGDCPQGVGNCGHVVVQIDGDSGNQNGESYNNLAWQNPILTKFYYVDNPAGPHTISVSLVHDNGDPVLVDGLPVADAVDVNVDINPRLSILLPNDSQLLIDNSEDRAGNIPFLLDNFELQAPGGCGDNERCGHIYVNIDGGSGNQSGQIYNNIAASNPAQALFGETNEPEGEHSLRLSLRYDDGNVVVVDGVAVEDTVSLTTLRSVLSLEIQSPLDGAQVSLNVDDGGSVPVTFSTPLFQLAQPGECLPADLPDCGFIKIFVDDNDGNAPGLDYNSIATSVSDGKAYFAYVDTPTAYHTISAQLFYDDGTPVLTDGEVVVDSTTVFVTFPEDPQLNILSPVSDTANLVNLGTDDLQTVLVSYTLNGYTLSAPGTCGDNINCGHLYVKIDSEDGNQPGEEFNNLDTGFAAGVADAYFAYLDDPTGPHTITLSLRRDDGSPYVLYGYPLEVSTAVETAEVVPELQLIGLSDGDPVVISPDVDGSVIVGYQLRNFVQREPGQCTGEETEACGHVELYVDDVLNNVSYFNPAQAKFALLDSPTGRHNLRLAVVGTDGQPILVDGEPLQQSIDIYAQNSGEPFIRILAPLEGGELTLYGDNQTGFITFIATNVTLAEPGQTCQNPDGTPGQNCAYIVLNIDGDDGNRPRRDYNNQWFTQLPAAALFSLLDDPLGEHTVSLRLFDHSTKTPMILSSGLTPTDEVLVTTTLPPENTSF